MRNSARIVHPSAPPSSSAFTFGDVQLHAFCSVAGFTQKQKLCMFGHKHFLSCSSEIFVCSCLSKIFQQLPGRVTNGNQQVLVLERVGSSSVRSLFRVSGTSGRMIHTITVRVRICCLLSRPSF